MIAISIHVHAQNGANHRTRIVIHGGAGTILKNNMTPEREKEYIDKITEVLLAGDSVLQHGGSSLDAVETTIRMMEDSPLFNAGKGAVFTHDGTNELDASIMDGDSLKAGAVASVKHIKNPISLARMVMEKSPHVMMVGDGAEKFATENGMQLVDQKYFYTKRRWDELQKTLNSKDTSKPYTDTTERKHGTVGCVALDKDGNLAAGTSTGGMTNKMYGRVGDSPIIGAGTYANNKTCAVSSTGWGEYFIRSVVAYDISALMEYKGLSVSDAANTVIMDKLTKAGGTGGVIALDRNGNIAMPFNTAGMYRAYIDENGKPVVKIYKD
ncbi:MAG: isoaspartyl peptidase/L-asparaginase family protein [Bacteroidota bacterium]